MQLTVVENSDIQSGAGTEDQQDWERFISIIIINFVCSQDWDFQLWLIFFTASPTVLCFG